MNGKKQLKPGVASLTWFNCSFYFMNFFLGVGVGVGGGYIGNGAPVSHLYMSEG